MFDIHVLLASALRNEGSPTPPTPMAGAAVGMGPTGVMSGLNAPPSHLGPHQRGGGGGGGGGTNMSAVRSNPLSSVIASLLTFDETSLNALRNTNATVADDTAATAVATVLGADRNNYRINGDAITPSNGMNIPVAAVGGVASPGIGNIENSSINQRLISPPSISSFATSSSASMLTGDASQSPPLSPPLPVVDVDASAAFLSASSMLSMHSNSSNNDSDTNPSSSNHSSPTTGIGGPVTSTSTPSHASSSNNNPPLTAGVGGPMPIASTALPMPVASTALASWFDARREVCKGEDDFMI